MSETPSSPTTPPQVGGRYVLLSELGRGGMATVYRARDEVLDRQVAVKILHPHLADDHAFLDRFRREARAAAALSHPNVVAVHDWGETPEGAYLVLQLVEGPTLRQLLREHGRFSPEEAAGLLIPVARGLGAAHAAGMVHRDVKPENLLLGRDGIVRITDFGLARAIASANATFGTDVLIGSPHYLAPEAVEGDRLDPRADVYALGVILFECLTGAPPHSAETAFATAMRHTTHTVPAPSSLVDGIPAGLDDVVRWATAIDRGTRYPTGDDLARALGVAVPEVSHPGDLDTGAPYDRTARASGAGAAAAAPSATDVLGHHEQLWDAPGNDYGDEGYEDDVYGDGSGAPEEEDGYVDEEHADAEEDVYETDVVGVWRRRPGWTAALVILGLILASGVGGYLLWDRLIAPVLPVPDVQGEMQDTAADQLVEDGFRPEVVESRHDPEVPEGAVIDQEPLGQARRGSDVVLVISAGPRQVEIHDVRGWSEAEAVERLTDLDFEVELSSRHDDEIAEGEVIEVEPPVGSLADESSTVVVTISDGPEPIDVPDLSGEDATDAAAALRELGLELDVVERRHDDSVPEGHIISQDPGSDQALLPGGSVEAVVSDGPAPIEVPSVRGEHVDDAIATLEELGFEVEVDWRDGIGSLIQPGRVIDQNPSPGSERLPGTTIIVFAYER